jgi:hypothetical protein
MLPNSGNLFSFRPVLDGVKKSFLQLILSYSGWVTGVIAIAIFPLLWWIDLNLWWLRFVALPIYTFNCPFVFIWPRGTAIQLTQWKPNSSTFLYITALNHCKTHSVGTQYTQKEIGIITNISSPSQIPETTETVSEKKHIELAPNGSPIVQHLFTLPHWTIVKFIQWEHNIPRSKLKS